MSTVVGNHPNVTLKLPQLQNLCKRDPIGYKDDYLAQTRRLESELAILQHTDGTNAQRTVELIQFAAAVASSSYKGDESDRIANLLMDLLGKSSNDFSKAASLHRDVRRSCVSALIIMRNKGTVSPGPLQQLFFNVMVAVVDKGLREMLFRHLVNDIKNLNKKGKRDEAVNRSIQTFLHRIIQTTNANPNSGDGQVEFASKKAVDITCELYRRRVWTDERAVAIVATAVESPFSGVSNRAMRFFLGMEDQMAMDEQTKIENEYDASNVIDYHLHSRKTNRRQRQTARALKNRKKAQLKKEASFSDGVLDITMDEGVEASRKLFPAVELLRDPQGLAETVLKRLRNGKEKYETKLLRINFVTRLTGNHELLLLPLYSFLQKYMGGHQRDVTAVLAYTVQACHSLVPPDEIYGILKTIAHNFITERCTEEQMAVGINAARSICARVPAVMSQEEAQDSMDVEAFARDLAGFAKHRDRSVRIAGSGWLNWVRQTHPGLLQGKDRGMEGTALHRSGSKTLLYGQSAAASGVEGADLLAEYESKKRAAVQANSDDEGEDEGGSEDNCEEEGDEEPEYGEGEEEGGGEEVNAEPDDDDDDDDNAPELVEVDIEGSEPVIDLSKMTEEERDKLKQELSSTRIYSTEDFVKMRKLVDREERAKRDPREQARRKRAIAAGLEFEALSDDSDSSDDDEGGVNVKGTVGPEDIMAAATRKRQNKAERLKKIIAGRTQFENKQREGGSTNIEKLRKKNFLMTKFSREARTKGSGKNKMQAKKREMAMKGTHESKKRRRKL